MTSPIATNRLPAQRRTASDSPHNVYVVTRRILSLCGYRPLRSAIALILLAGPLAFAASEAPMAPPGGAVREVPAGPRTREACQLEIRTLQRQLSAAREQAATNLAALALQAKAESNRSAIAAHLLASKPELKAFSDQLAQLAAERAPLQSELDALPAPTGRCDPTPHEHADDPAVIARRTELQHAIRELDTRIATVNRAIEKQTAALRKTDPQVARLTAETIEAEHLLAAGITADPGVAAVQRRLDDMRKTYATLSAITTNSPTAGTTVPPPGTTERDEVLTERR